MANQYSPFQYVPERSVAKIYFLKCWARKTLPGNRTVGYCWVMPNLYTPFQILPERGGAEIYFIKSYSRKKISGNKAVGYCLEIH